MASHPAKFLVHRYSHSADNEAEKPRKSDDLSSFATRQVRASTDPEGRYQYRVGSAAEISQAFLSDAGPLGLQDNYTTSPIGYQFADVAPENPAWDKDPKSLGSDILIDTTKSSSSGSRWDGKFAPTPRRDKRPGMTIRKQTVSSQVTKEGEDLTVKVNRCSTSATRKETEMNRPTAGIKQDGAMTEMREASHLIEQLRSLINSGKREEVKREFQNMSLNEQTSCVAELRRVMSRQESDESSSSGSTSQSDQGHNEGIDGGGDQVSDLDSSEEVVIQEQQGNDQPSPSASSPTEPNLQGVLTDVQSLLDVVKQWSKRTNDNSVLESILDRIDDICTNISYSPTQLGGHDLPDGNSTRSFFQNGQYSSSECYSSDCHGLKGHTLLPRNGNLDQNQPTVRIAKKHTGGFAKALRCPYFFGRQEQPCQTLHKYIRDLTRHLKCHGFYFCSKCSEHFTDAYEMQGHQCGDKVCIDLECQNRPETEQVHRRQQGCKPRFDDLDTPTKWYSLYSLQFPRLKRPIWDEVSVYASNNSGTPSSTDCAVSLLPLTTVSSGESGDVEAVALSTPGLGDTSPNNEQDSPATDRNAVDHIARVILQRVEAHVLQQSRTIMTQNEMLEQQNERCRNHETQIHDLRNEVIALRNNILPSGNDPIETNSGQLVGEQMQVDSTSPDAQWR